MSDFLNIGERITTITRQIEAENANKSTKQIASDKMAMEEMSSAGMFDGVVHLAPGMAEEMGNEEREKLEKRARDEEQQRLMQQPLRMNDVSSKTSFV